VTDSCAPALRHEPSHAGARHCRCNPARAGARRSGWFSRLAQGLRKTGAGIAQVFTGTRIDDALYEELESALLLADTGVSATEFCWPT
jgi:fused signal recognition particle receptor